MTDRSHAQFARGEAFRALHADAKGFLIPNPWDVGSARLLSHLGFNALATTSAGFAFSRGQADNAVPRAALMAHLTEIASCVDLPISADLQNGFGDSPESVVQTIQMAALTGIVGGSIEDATGRADSPQYSREVAATRIRAAADAARALPFPFTLTARAENYSVGKPDLADVIERLQAYQEAGADVLYAPFMTNPQDIATLVRELDKPINVNTGFAAMKLTVPELLAIGVRRVSVGAYLARTAMGAFLRSATELRDSGTISSVNDATSARELNRLFG